jgi:PAS domain S-box-containing protein
VTGAGEALADSAEELFEEAPCGYLTTRLDGTILRVNRTFERWTGRARDELVGRRFQDLLSAGGRIYHETHFAPLLQMQGAASEVAFDVVRADGSRLPALVSSVVRGDADMRVVRTTVFDATDRRRYEQELLRARDRERVVALELQRSLLSGELPVGDAFAVDVAYRPGVKGLSVGGDWYDAFWLTPGERLAVVVGDVVGRGIAAGATMGQLRSALRALAVGELGPARVLEALDGYVRRHDVGTMTTIAYAQLDVTSGEVCLCCAGHPPPVVLEPGRPARFEWAGRSLPLDAFGRPHERAEGRFVLPPGGALVLYTDGLVERRGSTLPEGMDALLAALDRRDDPAGAFSAGLVDELAPHDGAADDVCVLAARLRPCH